MTDSDPITRLNAALEGRYRIESELGEGGMATVYLADDIKHERKVALKVLKPEDTEEDTNMKRAFTLWLCLGLMFLAAPLAAQARVEENVVYGMYSGLALLMDVHHPAEPNGKGLIWIFGSAFQAPTTYGAWQLKQAGVQPPIFLDVGYTVFCY